MNLETFVRTEIAKEAETIDENSLIWHPGVSIDACQHRGLIDPCAGFKSLFWPELLR